jgi:hypothetical protein
MLEIVSMFDDFDRSELNIDELLGCLKKNVIELDSITRHIAEKSEIAKRDLRDEYIMVKSS